MRRAIVLVLVMTGCGTTESAPENERPSESAPEARPSEPVEAPAEADEHEPADPSQVCVAIVEAGIGANCARAVPDRINARARMRFDFELVHLPGEGGAVLSFEDAEDFDATVAAYEAVAQFAGAHRYGNRDALIFVQMNHDASLEDGDRVRAIVDAL